ncbi:MAG: hypothetical protein EPN84_10480 [Legionella sp.]|nr:MAG: hypothetical protein EPN84_10480 [Legionella sp.]
MPKEKTTPIRYIIRIVRSFATNTRSESAANTSHKRSHSDATESSTSAISVVTVTSNPMNDLLARSYPNGIVHGQEPERSIIRSETLEQSLDALSFNTESEESALSHKAKRMKSDFDEKLPHNRHSFMSSLELLPAELSDNEFEEPLKGYTPESNDDDNDCFRP